MTFNANINSTMVRVAWEKMTSTDRVLILIYSYLPLCGHISITGLKLFGITVTPYRALIPLIFMLFLVPRLEFDRGVLIKIYHGKQQIRFCLTVGIMFFYGVISLFGSPYVVMREGYLELYNIFLGILSVFIVCEISLIKGGIQFLFNAFRAIILVFVLLGLLEIVTGKHLAVSRYADPAFLSSLGFESKTIKMASGLYYNVNDFSAVISLFSPLFYFRRHASYFVKILSIITLVSITFILLVNDSWISLFAFLVGFVYYFFASNSKSRARGLLFGVLGFLLVAYLGGEIYVAVSHQFHAASQQRGSLFLRLNTYLVSVRETIIQTYGFGFGVGSFSNVMEQLREPHVLVNPHSLWIEIFTQYGVIVITLFASFLLNIFRSLYRKHISQAKNNYLLISVLAMFIIFIMVAFSSSSWLKSSVMWLPIALSLALTLDIRNENADGILTGTLCSS